MFVHNVARMMQKFISKKNSIGYSHPPIIDGEKSFFKVHDQKGNLYMVTVQPWTMDDELRGINSACETTSISSNN